MICAACGAAGRDDARFCAECGAAREAPACPGCGAATAGGQRFCAECGLPLAAAAAPPPARPHPADGERKPVTVLFCDIVDSTGLAQRLGDEAMHELLRRFFDLALDEVARFGGTIDKFLGDGFMALVGVPAAHEDHARRAVLAALGIRERLAAGELTAGVAGAPLQVRMGLNSGQVVVGTLGDDRGEDHTAIGDVINVAARLQAMASPGEILVAESTGRLVEGYARTEALGARDVRGRTVPVGVHRVLSRGGRRSPLPTGPGGLSRFVGRERQLAALEDLLEQAREGRGQAAGIVAEPGMGKTRLVAEFRRSIAGHAVTVLEGRCLSYGASIPWVPVIDIVRADCRIAETDSPAVVVAKVRRSLDRLGLDADAGAPVLLQMLGLREGRDALAALSPEAVKARTLEVLLQMSLAGSRRQPLVFVVEDLHWIDRVSEEWLELLVENLQGAAIMLVCTYRPGYQAPWLQRSYASQLVLPRLRAGDAREVVRGILAAEVVDTMADVVVARAEGNPFFLEELSRALGERGEVASEAPVPTTIQDVLAARVDRLPEEPRRALQTASVLGREFGVRLLEEIWDGAVALPPLLAELKRLEFLYERAQAGEPLLVFKHALIQDVAYEGLLGSRRRVLHEAAGAALERIYAGRLEEVDDRLAHHYGRTDRSDKAVEYLDRFARRAVRTYAHAEASRALREALVHVERLPEEERARRAVGLVMRLVASLYFLGRFGESLDLLLHHEPAVEALADPRLSGPFYMWLGHTYTHAGDSDGAARAVETAFAHARPLGDRATVGKSHYVLAREGFWLGRLGEGAEHGRAAVAALRETDDWWWLAHSHSWTGLNLCNLGRLDEALAEVAEARAIGADRADPRIHSYSAWNAGWIQATRGDWEAAIADCTESLRTSPDTLNSSYSMGWLGFAYREAGDYEEAVRHLERSIALLTEFRYSRLVAWFDGWLSEAYLWRGDVDRALEVADHGLRIAREVRYPWGMALARRALGRIALARGAAVEAERHLTEALRELEGMDARFDAGCVLLSLAEAARCRGDAAGARAIAVRTRARFAELGTPVYLARAERLAAELGAPDAAVTSA